MRTERQHNLDRAVCLALSRMGALPLTQPILVDTICRAVAPRGLPTEAEESIRHMESRGFIARVPGETAPDVALTQAGRLWWAQQA